MRPLRSLLASLALVLCLPLSARALELDLSQLADWGPPTAADSLAHELRHARWTEDADRFTDARERLWAASPHDSRAILETVFWFRDEGRLAEIRATADDAALAALIGLPEADASDLELTRGLALTCSGRLTSARPVLERARARHPLAWDYLLWTAAQSAAPAREIAEVYAQGAREPGASAAMVQTLLGGSVFGPFGRQTAAIAALVAERAPHPQIDEILAIETVSDSLAARPRPLAEAAAMIDAVRAEAPEAMSVSLDDLIGDVRNWHSAAAALSLFEPRAEWMPPRRRAVAHAQLLVAAERAHEAYELLLPLMRDERHAPPRTGMHPAMTWHPDASELERWAWRLVDERLGSWQVATAILADRGLARAADSLRTVAEREIPAPFLRDRAEELRYEDPAGAARITERLAASVGPQTTALVEAWLTASRGEIARLDSLLAAYPSRVHTGLVWQAALGSANQQDPAVLRSLAERALRTMPDHTALLGLLADLATHAGDLELANRLVDTLSDHPYPPPRLHGTRIDMAMHAGDADAARDELARFLDGDAPGPDALLVQPAYAEGAGWPDLADQALADLLEVAPRAPAVLLAQARMLTRRGDHHQARAVLEPLAEDWPDRTAVRRALVAAGGSVEAYRDAKLPLDAEQFAGLQTDHEAVDWILAARAEPGEFPDADVLVLRDRHTYHVVARDLMIKRRHLTVEILGESGVSSFDTERHTFDVDDGQPRVVAARVIGPDGQVRDVPRSSILITAHEGDQADVSETRDLVIPFSGVKPGAVVDYCIETQQDGFLKLGVGFEHFFGFGAPQREERVEIVVADGLEAHVFDRHAPVEAERTPVDGGTCWTWSAHDIPSTHFEQAAPPTAILADWIGLATYDRWDDMAAEYGRVFWPQVVVTGQLESLARELTADLDDDRERLQALYTHVRDEVSSVGIELGDGRFVPTPATEVLDRGYGDCKDKVAALTALLQTLDIECRPVLVATRPGLDIEPDFPYSGRFNHLIAYVPDVDGGVFCDPTLGGECVDGLSDDVIGRRVLVIDRDGDGDVEQLPELDLDEPQIAVEVDLYPEPSGHLRAEVLARIWGPTAQATESLFAMPDTNLQNAVVKSLVGHQLDDQVSLVHWERRTTGCDAYEVRAVLRDSSWTTPDSHDARTLWITLADTGLELPDPDDRTLPVALDAPQVFVSRIRAHEALGWRVSDRHAPIRVHAPDYEAEVSVDMREKDGERWLEVVREERFGRREYDAEDYARVHDQGLSYRLATYQPFTYQRRGDPERIDQLRAYCRDNPDDLAFAMQAAMQVLGGDLGGSGEAGEERRAVAREMIDPILHNPQTGGMPFLLAAGMAMTDDHYLRADSLLTVALQRSPSDPYLLGMATSVCQELGDQERLLEHLRATQALTGSPQFSYTLVATYLGLEQDDLAEREVQRLELMAAEIDSLQLAGSRIDGYLRSHRLEEAEHVLAAHEDALMPVMVDLYHAELASQRRDWEDAIASIADVQNERPLDTMLNNNLAWYLACAGRDLDRAEYLARMSLALSDDAGTNNTLAVILMQQGRRDEARAMLADLYEDDRPPVRLTNGYFLGLCDWIAGDRDSAVKIWREVDGLAPHDEFATVVRETLDAIDRGDDPSWLYLREPRAEE
jgi:tetratricopeptide (TPR) repeat protein